MYVVVTFSFMTALRHQHRFGTFIYSIATVLFDAKATMERSLAA